MKRCVDKGPPKHLWEGLREAVSSPQLIITSSLTEMLLHGESEAHWVALLLRDQEHNIPSLINYPQGLLGLCIPKSDFTKETEDSTDPSFLELSHKYHQPIQVRVGQLTQEVQRLKMGKSHMLNICIFQKFSLYKNNRYFFDKDRQNLHCQQGSEICK